MLPQPQSAKNVGTPTWFVSNKIRWFGPGEVILSSDAYRQIREQIEDAGNQYETGGVLLGHKKLRRFFIVAVTPPCGIPDPALTAFVLDGPQHTRTAAQLAQRFRRRPSIVGVWHSHICDGAVFSAQDRQSNRLLAQHLGGAVSILAAPAELGRTSVLTSCFIPAHGREHICVTIIDFQNRMIPKGYRKMRSPFPI